MGLLSKIGLGDLEARPPRERATFFFLVAMSTFLFMDQNLTAPNLTAIGEELVVSRQEVEQRLQRDDAEYQRLTRELEARKELVDELPGRERSTREDLLVQNPKLADHPAALARAIVEV